MSWRRTHTQHTNTYTDPLALSFRSQHLRACERVGAGVDVNFVCGAHAGEHVALKYIRLEDEDSGVPWCGTVACDLGAHVGCSRVVCVRVCVFISVCICFERI